MTYTNEFLEIEGLGYSIKIELEAGEWDWNLSTLEINKLQPVDSLEGQELIEPTDYHYAKAEEYLVNEGAFKLAS